MSNSDVDEAEASLAEFKSRLSEFIKTNPKVKIGYADEGDRLQSVASIHSAWGDDSIGISCKLEDEKFISVLNEIYLPERYSAIYHTKRKTFEVAWTAYPLPERYAEILKRSFDFVHNGNTYNCRYGLSSAALLEIAARFFPDGATNSTDYRNLFSFSTYSDYYDAEGKPQKGEEEADIPDYIRSGKPISFYIDIPSWDEDVVFDLVNHVNFYMTYYDTLSPMISVHSPQDENITQQPQKRLAYGEFPKHIISRSLDDNLLHFWQAARFGDPARRFLYNYQIIEYASFVVLEETISKSVRKLLSSPHILSSTDVIVSQILELTSESKISDPQKIEGLFRRVIDPKLIWNEMQLNMGAFNCRTSFDGGHAIPPLVKEKWVEADFVQIWPIQFATTLRNIRNALSHGREQRMTAVITPTAENLRKLQAWVPLVEVAAREVMVYRHMAD